MGQGHAGQGDRECLVWSCSPFLMGKEGRLDKDATPPTGRTEEPQCEGGGEQKPGPSPPGALRPA